MDDGGNLHAWEEMAGDAWATVKKLQRIVILEACIIGALIGALLR